MEQGCFCLPVDQICHFHARRLGAHPDERHHLPSVFKYCSPTRRGFLSGRYPVHMSNAQAGVCSNWLPLEMTLLPQKLALANFTSHFVGKGHLGYQVPWTALLHD